MNTVRRAVRSIFRGALRTGLPVAEDGEDTSSADEILETGGGRLMGAA